MDLTFRNSVWLFPFAFVMHVLEEWPGFVGWAKRHASIHFTQQDYRTVHIAGIVMAFVLAAVVSRFPNRVVVFLFFAFVFAPALFFNTFFHVGGTILTREYSPGAITAMVLYLPVFYVVSRFACNENLLDRKSLIVALIVAAAFHTWEVGHNVFKAW